MNGELRGEPTEVALYRAACEALGKSRGDRMREFPFDAERKRMSTMNTVDGAAAVMTKGAPESVLAVCTRCLKDGKQIPLDESLKEEVTSLYHSFMDQGLRVLAFAYRDAGPGERVTSKEDAEREMVFAGLIGLEDPPRPEVAGAITKCRDAGIRIIMITGDASRTAVAIAREIGLVVGEPTVVEGGDFLKMSDWELRAALAKSEVLFTRMTPKHKLRVVNILKGEGERVAVTGDGVNDAPALKRADIGIAMGVTGTDVAKEAADMILLDDNFATIVSAVEEGRAVFANIRKFISYIFSSNVPEIVPYLASVLFRIPLPLTIMQILAVDLGTDMLPALALGAEKPSPDVMKAPPRSPKERLLNMPLFTRAYLFLGPIEAAAALFGFFSVLYSGGWQWGQTLAADNLLYVQATTACLTAIIVTQIANVFACRSLRESVFSLGFFSNPLIFAGIAVELLLQLFIVYHPLGNRIFSTAPLPFSLWMLFVPFALALFFAEEMRKLVLRKLRPL
jgi:sodium/potassium-transporting ATPase subunit alpha